MRALSRNVLSKNPEEQDLLKNLYSRLLEAKITNLNNFCDLAKYVHSIKAYLHSIKASENIINEKEYLCLLKEYLCLLNEPLTTLQLCLENYKKNIQSSSFLGIKYNKMSSKDIYIFENNIIACEMMSQNVFKNIPEIIKQEPIKIDEEIPDRNILISDRIKHLESQAYSIPKKVIWKRRLLMLLLFTLTLMLGLIILFAYFKLFPIPSSLAVYNIVNKTNESHLASAMSFIPVREKIPTILSPKRECIAQDTQAQIFYTLVFELLQAIETHNSLSPEIKKFTKFLIEESTVMFLKGYNARFEEIRNSRTKKGILILSKIAEIIENINPKIINKPHELLKNKGSDEGKDEGYTLAQILNCSRFFSTSRTTMRDRVEKKCNITENDTWGNPVKISALVVKRA